MGFLSPAEAKDAPEEPALRDIFLHVRAFVTDLSTSIPRGAKTFGNAIGRRGFPSYTSSTGQERMVDRGVLAARAFGARATPLP